MNNQKYLCFLAIQYSKEFQRLRKVIESGVREAGFTIVTLDQSTVFPSSTIQDTLISEIARADCIIVDVTTRNPNVFFELGLAKAMGKGIIIIADEQSYHNVPVDISQFRVILYSNKLKDLEILSKRISESLNDFRRFPTQKNISPALQYSSPFFVDWESLSERDVENLCQELLAQMGYRRLDWGKGSPEIDLIAELPKKDPDGFEYKELWLITLGLKAPFEMFIDIASKEPEYFIHRLTRFSNNYDERYLADYESSVTLLFILFKRSSDFEEIEYLKERLEKRKYSKRGLGVNIRLRIWDQNYLTSVVQRFPHIGFKYFSDEGRIRSKSRKSYEELYKENSNYSIRQSKLISDLENEKNKRVRAERDSVWKDISFSAAHKIGNPIFAIETDIDPLKKRITEKRHVEALEVVSNMQSSIEKAKAFVEQFKSLARAQEIHVVSTLLKPILLDACRSLANQSIKCSLVCPDEIKVNGDPERLGECFDELVANSSHWFDKEEKLIELIVSLPDKKVTPDFLDSKQKYVLVHVKDNGCGIPVSDKSKIFNAFFTNYQHGTGLGLALVRRIVDGHGGGIIESGMPTKGADFEVYLPLSDDTKLKIKKER